MRSPVAVAVSAALMSMAMSVQASEQYSVSITKPDLPADTIQSVNLKLQQDLNFVNGQSRQKVFIPEDDLDAGVHRYFVRFDDSPVALYEGNIQGFKATSPAVTEGKSRKLDVNDSDVKAYRQYLTNRQDSVINQAKSKLGTLKIKQRTNLSYNGMVVEMTQAEAKKLALVSGVAHIKREVLRHTQTDAGPAIIQAPAVWDGSASGTATHGEGMVVGIIDTGINSDHPSFADVGGDNYDHTNPWGEGVYSGDCAADYPALCNDKLIGVHSWPLITDQYPYYDPDVAQNGEDHDGHGSHTASTTAGNFLYDLPISDVDGKPLGISFDAMSGVAPHANIVSYQVCKPGDDDAIGFNGCYPSLTVLAVEHAIENGVDALNYSIGGGTSDPWQDADALAFLAARKAGIHVATSAGNDGPDPQTVGSPGDAPWLTTVAAYTHDRDYSDKTLSEFTGGDTTAPSTLTGKAASGAFSGSIVYAGDFANANDPDGDPAQCLQPFPEETFADNTIVVCDRGAIARTAKGQNVLAGGAAGLVLANVQGGASSVVADAHTLPAIHIDATQGDALRTWLATGSDHTASISGTSIVKDESLARIAAAFTSRGANKSVPDIIVPSIAAPGVSIYAAYADEQSDKFKENPNPSDYSFLSGTSMASPHIAGALTLIAKLHPDWSPAEVQSALMLTADQNTFKEDGVTPSDFFDMGAGYANISAAAQTGLIMDETYEGYMAANPGIGGKPLEINLPTMANSQCVDTCTWTRLVKATADATWTVGTEGVTDGLGLSVIPTTFRLSEGNVQELTITADASAIDDGWNFANISLTANNLPNVKLPVAVKKGTDNIPAEISITAASIEGVVTYSDLTSNNLSGMTVGVYDKATLLVEPEEIDVPDGEFGYIAVTFDNDVDNVTFTTSSETAPDVDLRILDANNNNEKIGSSAGATSDESVTFIDLPAGTYYVVVDAFTASAPGATDKVLITASSIIVGDEYLSDNVVASVVENDNNFDLTFKWDTDQSVKGFLIVESGDKTASKQVPFLLTRQDAVAVTHTLSSEMIAGELTTVSFNIPANSTNEDVTYQLSAAIPSEHEIMNVSHDGVLSENGISWEVTQEVSEHSEEVMVSFDIIPRTSGSDYNLTLSHSFADNAVERDYGFGVLQAAPVAMVSFPETALEEGNVLLDGTGSSDANGDELTYQWTQTAGTSVTFDAAQASISFTAPVISESSELFEFELTVTDSEGNTGLATANITIQKEEVEAEPEPTPEPEADNEQAASKSSSGGSLGWLAMILLPLAWLRRKLAA
ncbi:S8 family serine peptidase [uncultured Shewanella sp.]|uniref:S8 family serine peptidase n=1 Tax=uncultured Shewanella sp. TaxID=173975 RepID=UPI00263978E0|nr:S8 family serine peptidase [uncultured Shewanella sp.]